ncbi:MAG: fibronectin type III domain-containing protein [Desulfobacterales bacterium]|nr:MAG: fibronectin type III domain-containing protein [Desulfobacterales bacterium]
MKKNNYKNISRKSSLSLYQGLLSAAVILALFLLPLLAYSADVTLAWDANTEPDLDGYKVYYGTSSRNYTNSVDAGNITEYTITGLTEGTTYYFAATAYDALDNESGYSAEVVYTITVLTYTITASAGANGSISPSGAVTLNQGDNQMFSITPNQNYHVADVVVDGTSVGAVTTYTFASIAGNHSITASFAPDNQPPTANAGPDQTVTEGTIVTLNGSNSADIGGSIVSYEWEQTAGIPAALVNSEAAQATFTAPNVGFAGETLTFRLTVTDNGGLQDVDYCSISVTKEQVRDSDGDGVPDEEDAFPFDPDEWLDTDGDGTGNNADEDDDDDGIPDEWENKYGLDPLQDDADEDPDGDGVSNIDEYYAGTDPTQDDYNSVPQRPVILSPENNDVVAMTPVFRTGEFYDPDSGDRHWKTQWLIFDELSNTRVMNIQTPSSLTSLKVPKLILDENTSYYVKVRFFDNHGAASEWSEPAVFMTDINAEDIDGNGIPDHQELEGPIDMDKDGTRDSKQDDIKCLSAEGQTTYLGISVKGCPTVLAIDSVVSEDARDVLEQSSASEKPDSMPFSLIHFKLLVNAPGDEALVTVYLSESAPENSKLYKYDPIEDIWYDYSDYAEFSPNGTSFTLTLQDGGFGDADGTENGIIVDPSGIGADIYAATSIDDDDEYDNDLEKLLDRINVSCFISAAADPSGNQQPWDLWREIRGRELSILFVMLVLIYACRVVEMKLRRGRRYIKID